MRYMVTMLLILMVSVSMMILYTSPDIITLFSGSHSIVDISPDENDVSCTSCHSRIQNELDRSAIHSNFKCEECHRLMKTSSGKIIEYAVHNSSGWYVGKQTHAAYTPRCLDCHGNNGIYYNDTWVAKQAPPAKAFNESNYGSDYSAHKPFVRYALNTTLSVGENEACIACHTNYSMKFEFKRPEWFYFTVQKSSKYLYLSNLQYGPVNTTPIMKSASGAKHEFSGISDIKCETCHSDIWHAANHTESRYPISDYFTTKASHIVWQWIKGSKGGDNPMHNVTCVYSEYGITYYNDVYDNITEYCTLSCHNPLMDEASSTVIPAVFQATTHAAKKVSCYDCHNETYDYNLYFWNKPLLGNRTAITKHYANDIYSEPIFVHAETCIACKRNGGFDGTFKAWTEPNNTIYYVEGGYYI